MNTDELRAGFDTACINASSTSSLACRPEFISNDYRAGRKVIASLDWELRHCDEFFFSVAFITMGGIEPFLMTFQELEKKHIPGKILTTDYSTFSEPGALKKLAGLSNIEVRMYRCEENNNDSKFHTKGYIFRDGELYRIIIGSSNATGHALTTNAEWNTKVVSTAQGQFAREILGEFQELWNQECTQKYEDFIEEYSESYYRKKLIDRQKEQALKSRPVSLDQYTLKPNRMQVAFVRNVMKMRQENVHKALFCSATASGKTIASAFAVREMGAKRILFLVHRERIAKQAMNSYRRVFGSSVTYGLISGSSRETEADFIFSTMQMMAKPEIYGQFTKDAFDVIIIDEAHHAGAESYRKIMGYFEPEFWLGMTASPDTAQYDIYAIFDHNIAYELRLNQAMEENLVCPFHYFGITDLEIDGEVLDDQTGVRNFARLVSDDRVDYILKQIRYYGYSGDRVKGLVFCSRLDEAEELSRKFNERGYRTVALSGADSDEKRAEAIERLSTDEEGTEQLDYIFSVDIFNEGVDIPEVNQVVMLRPTQSPVIFVQQLGRGLRKLEGKEYVVILDFIGNYMNNFMIPIALSGDRSYNKDNMRRYVQDGDRIIPGSSTIHFDEISRQRIFRSIDSARTSDMKLLRESYQNLKNKLNRIPSIRDFREYGSIDIHKIFEKCGSYYNFLKKYDRDYTVELSAGEQNIIEFLSTKVLSSKRVHELELLSELMEDRTVPGSAYAEALSTKYHQDLTAAAAESVYRNLTNRFAKGTDQKKFSGCVLVEKTEEGGYRLTDGFEKMLNHGEFRDMVRELLDYGLEDCREKYSHLYKDTAFQLYQKYTYEDVCRLLNWKKNGNAQNIGGYSYDAETRTLPVFINYVKEETAIAYEDRFLSESSLIALSKHPRKITSADVTHIYKRSEADRDNRIYLFVRRNKDDREAKEFYFLGEIYAQGEPKPIHMESTGDDAFEILYQLDVPVRSDIYDYITSK